MAVAAASAQRGGARADGVSEIVDSPSAEAIAPQEAREDTARLASGSASGSGCSKGKKKILEVQRYTKPRPLLEYAALPEYLRDNEFIHKHYRADWPLSQTLWSIFGIHNETGNIWTHLLGFILFVSITVYMAMRVPSSVEIPLSDLTLHRLQEKLPPTPSPSLENLRQTLSSQLPTSLSNLELPQLRQLQNMLSSLEVPQLKQLQRSLAHIELPHFANLRSKLPSVHLPRRFEALYNSLPTAPHLPNLEIGARLEAMYDSLPALPKLAELPHIPGLGELRQAAQASGARLYGAIPSVPSVQEMQDKAEEYMHVVAESLSHLPSLGQDVQEAAEPFLAKVAESLPQIPHIPQLASVGEHLKEVQEAVSGGIRDMQGAAHPYLAAAAERLSHLELLHSLHRVEMLMAGMEITRWHEALHSLAGYYSCLVNSLMSPPDGGGDTCRLDDKEGQSHPPVCGLPDMVSSVNASSSGKVNPVGELLSPGAENSTCPAPVLYSTPTVRWPMFLYLAGAMLCLLLSAGCHTLGCISCDVSRLVWRFDYAGIAALISASFFPPVFYGFLCYPAVRNFYLTIVLIMGTGTIAVSLLPKFQTPEYRHLRAGMFFGMGVSGIVPTVHKFLFFFREPFVVTTTLLELFMGSLYGLGAFFYASRIPERWMPGKFDIAGHSHQIFHVLVIAGAYVHYLTGLLYLQWRDLHGCGGYF